MKYLEPYKLFIIRKLLLEATNEPKEYQVMDFWYEKKPNWKDILEFLLGLDKNEMATLSDMKIKGTFFESAMRSYFEADYNWDGVLEGGINYQAFKRNNFLGLGEKLFLRAKEEIAEGDSNFSSPYAHKRYLSISKDELKSIDLSILDRTNAERDSLQDMHASDILFNLLFLISLPQKQQEKLDKYLDKYIEEFQNDSLDRTQAEDYFAYQKQHKILSFVIKKIGKDYPIHNLFLNNEKIKKHTENYLNDDELSKFRLIDTLLAFEKESSDSYVGNEDETVIAIGKMDVNMGIGVTEYKVPAPKIIITPIKKEPAALDLVKKQLDEGKEFKWYCKICGKLMKERIKTFENFKECLEKYSEDNPNNKCKDSRAHKNWFLIKDENIVMCGKVNVKNSGALFHNQSVDKEF